MADPRPPGFRIASIPWVDSGEAPPLALDRDKRDIISQGIADPLVDYDIVPLTYTNSRWSAFFYRCDEKDLNHILPKCLDLEDDVVEFSPCGRSSRSRLSWCARTRLTACGQPGP